MRILGLQASLVLMEYRMKVCLTGCFRNRTPYTKEQNKSLNKLKHLKKFADKLNRYFYV